LGVSGSKCGSHQPATPSPVVFGDIRSADVSWLKRKAVVIPAMPAPNTHTLICEPTREMEMEQVLIFP